MATHERMLTRRHASASSLPLVSESNRLYTLDRHFDELNILNKDLFDKINNTTILQPDQPYRSFCEHSYHDNSHEFSKAIYSKSR
jgi:hypothetical protein